MYARCIFFFFQAEDGIRDLYVTGVQTCALPISHDVQGLRAIIDSPAAYIGMIGSQRRVWAVFKLLHQDGMPAEKLARVRAPIGLDLGGASPEEIALSIMAEIVMLRHGGTGHAMSESLRKRYMERVHRMDEEE